MTSFFWFLFLTRLPIPNCMVYFLFEWRLISKEIVRLWLSILLQLFLKQEAPVEPEVVVTPKNVQRKRKTTHADPSYGSFFLRVGAIGEFLKRFNDFYTFWIDIELGINLNSFLFNFVSLIAFGLGTMIYVGLELGSFFGKWFHVKFDFWRQIVRLRTILSTEFESIFRILPSPLNENTGFNSIFSQ